MKIELQIERLYSSPAVRGAAASRHNEGEVKGPPEAPRYNVSVMFVRFQGAHNIGSTCSLSYNYCMSDSCRIYLQLMNGIFMSYNMYVYIYMLASICVIRQFVKILKILGNL